MKKHIRGYSIEIGIELFGRTFFVDFYPLKWWRPICTIHDGSPAMVDSPHMYIGPFYLWKFTSGATLGLTLDVDYNPFWNSNLSVPRGSKRIF